LDDEGIDIAVTADKGYAIVGKTASYGKGGTDVYLIKTDSKGNIEWKKTFGDEYDDVGNSIKVTSDGGFIISGASKDKSDTSRLYLIKTDSEGNIYE